MASRLQHVGMGAVLIAPGTVQAQSIHPIVAVAALSPVLVLLIAVLLGWLTRSVRIGAINAGLTAVWISWFWIASYVATNDYVIWAPMAAYLLHSTIMLGLVIWYVVKRLNGKSGAVA